MRRTRAELALFATQDRVEALAVRHGRRVAKVVALVVPATLALTGVAVWRQLPPEPSDPTVTQVAGACCASPGFPGITVGSQGGEDRGASLLLFPLGGPSRVDGDSMSLSYDLFVWDGDDERSHDLADPDLRVGDTVVHGPATIEIVAIHDAVWDRNDAVDLRVSFDLGRIDATP